jgi:hypothetical protein
VRRHFEPAGAISPCRLEVVGCFYLQEAALRAEEELRVDRWMRELAEEEAVGEMSSFKDRHGRFLLPLSLECQVGMRWEVGSLLSDLVSSQSHQVPGAADGCVSL